MISMYCRQDTNGLALHTLAPVLGVSTAREFEVNSMAIPRKAKQAVGGITTLTREDGKQMTVGQVSSNRGDVGTLFHSLFTRLIFPNLTV